LPDETIARLKRAAMAGSANAYSPHSHYKVGAALLAADGSVHVGCNVESDSYGLTQCAERTALAAAVVAGVAKGTGRAMLIYVPGPEPLPPCGACRQVMMELLAADAAVLSVCDLPPFLSWRCDELMPGAFVMK
jgi:cytidine deaminase